MSSSPYGQFPSLVDRTVLITGGATGIGESFVEHFVAQGAKVGFLDIDQNAGEALAERLGDARHKPLFLRCDLTDIDALKKAIADVRAAFGPIGVLINNAANDVRHSIESVTPESFDKGIAVNLRHQFFAAQAVVEDMKSLKGGSIINLGSISAHIDLLELPVYITAKAGIEGLTRTLARELGSWGIRVNCLIPGWIMTERQLAEWVTPEAIASIERNQCLPHKLYPDDVARLMLWLAADDSRSCTAQRWVVDGGWM